MLASSLCAGKTSDRLPVSLVTAELRTGSVNPLSWGARVAVDWEVPDAEGLVTALSSSDAQRHGRVLIPSARSSRDSGLLVRGFGWQLRYSDPRLCWRLPRKIGAHRPCVTRRPEGGTKVTAFDDVPVCIEDRPISRIGSTPTGPLSLLNRPWR